MRLRDFRPLDRGEVSILAAFVFVVILAGAGLFFQSFAPASRQSQTATVKKESQLATADTPAGTTSVCNAGEVHTVTETKGSSEKPQDKSVQCYVPDPKSPKTMIRNPATQNDVSCKDSKPNACTVRYCPPDSLGKTAGPWIVIQCAAGGGGQDCLNKNLNTALNSNTPAGAIANLSKQNFAVSLPSGAGPVNGSGVLSAALSTDGKQQMINELAQQNTSLQDQIAKYARACSGEYSATCDSADVQKLQQLQAQQALTQEQLKSLGSDAQILC